VRTRHGEVLARRRGGARGAHRAPVRDDDTIEAPGPLERLGQQWALRHGGAVDAVVAGHDEPDAGFDGRREGCEVDLAQGALADADVDGEAFGLGVVGRVVLGGGRDAVRLNAPDQRGSGAAGQPRVFREAFGVPAAEGCAVQVERGREDDVHAFAPGLGG
jgi:hypothetical protein